jgi:hypothetical protein
MTNTVETGYVGEYRDKFKPTPHTHEDRDSGVTTNVNNGEVVEVQAVHPNYRDLVLDQHAGAQALKAVQRVFE